LGKNGVGYLVTECNAYSSFMKNVNVALSDLHHMTALLVWQKMGKQGAINKEILKEVDEKLQRLTVNVEDDAVKSELGRLLYDWICASTTRKEQKRKVEITAKAQELLDTLEDDEDDERETVRDRLLLRVQQPSGNTANAPNDIDWRGECVSNILRDCQKKFREKLREQKKDLTAKFEAKTKQKIDGMKDEQALKDAEKEAVIRDLTEKLDAETLSRGIACSEAERERRCREKLEDPLDVLRQTENQRRQELVRVRHQSDRHRERIRELEQEKSGSTVVGNAVSIGYRLGSLFN
jgi:hypothetical protein